MKIEVLSSQWCTFAVIVLTKGLGPANISGIQARSRITIGLQKFKSFFFFLRISAKSKELIGYLGNYP